ncbi:MAG: DUF4062 domain-containing protein [Chloroflexia bacterium]|nr:DUF4062 domain-containing protein [Chloroflexia bacterium]
MSEQTARARVFISSTIHDFSDLRSALKFWLEELGLEVRLSEQNDFERRPDQGTFDSCFSAIPACHYYILLIGGRKGSEYRDGVSVTQQEYRTAAELAKRGEISPVILVRSDVMTALSERRAIQHGSHQGSISTTPSPVLRDPEFVAAFVDEIKSTEYERLGDQGPAGNQWYYRFGTFRDIIDALRVNLRLSGSLRAQTLLANLAWENAETIKTICWRHSSTGLPQPAHWHLGKLRSNRPLEVGEDMTLDSAEATAVVNFYMLTPMADQIKTVALRDASLSGEFLIYDQRTGRLQASVLLTTMYALEREIERYRNLKAMIVDPTHRFVEPALAAAQGYRSSAIMKEIAMATMYGLYDTLDNILRLCSAIHGYVQRPEEGIVLPDLHGSRPYPVGQEEIDEERASHEDAERWLNDSKVRNFMSGNTSVELDAS